MGDVAGIVVEILESRFAEISSCKVFEVDAVLGGGVFNSSSRKPLLEVGVCQAKEKEGKQECVNVHYGKSIKIILVLEASV